MVKHVSFPSRCERFDALGIFAVAPEHWMKFKVAVADILLATVDPSELILWG